MVLFGLALLAGLLTVLAPCAVTLLPGVVAPAMAQGQRGARAWTAPVVVAASLAVSVFLATILLKWLTVTSGLPPHLWRWLSAALLVIAALALWFPAAWDRISERTGLAAGARRGLSASRRVEGPLRWVVTGVALGPVFSSCSPVYAFILASVLPSAPAYGLVLLLAYVVGLATGVLGLAVGGLHLVRRLGWAINPDGWVRRVAAAGLVLTAVLVGSGLQRTAEDLTATSVPSTSGWEQELLRRAVPPTAPTPESASGTAEPLSSLTARMSEIPYPAAPFTGLTNPINAAEVPDWPALRGDVVVVDFWTFGCVNCRNTQPMLNAWQERFAARGLRIVGVHAPEFGYEREPANVETAVREAGIRYAVALDNDFATWRSFGIRAWPTMVFVDRAGMVRHIHVGEGDGDNGTAVIEALLAEPRPER
jgi:cytochrome c biogenesis protein CcdA/thiol-disulfide isomerase/thioredoxin